MSRRLLLGAAALVLAAAPALAQRPAGPAAPPRAGGAVQAQANPGDQKEIANAKAWNANPAGKDPHDFQGVWLIRHDVFGAAPLTGAPVSTDANRQFFTPVTPLQAATAKYRIDMYNAGTPLADASSQCLPHGAPRIMFSGYPLQIDYGPDVILILHEVTHDVRIIHLDGKPAPANEPLSFMGYSRGRWDGPTLIVDTDHLNDQSSLDEEGLSHGTKLKVHEEITRFTNRYGGVELLDLITIDDPDYYTRPWTTSKIFSWRGDMGITEYTCEENNRNQAVNGVTVAR